MCPGYKAIHVLRVCALLKTNSVLCLSNYHMLKVGKSFFFTCRPAVISCLSVELPYVFHLFSLSVSKMLNFKLLFLPYLA